ncbi:MAG: hypothetical protein EKK48_10365 [Candidatus Melainabacteria bacterium]|nr:MAG: hypothetical protein EKK48_10365 [Candidatus Melainabacteria bacterium]
MKRLLVVALVASTLLSGCASFNPPANTHELTVGKAYWIDTDATRRGIVVLPRADGKGMQVCSEPSPDVALQTVTQLMAQVSLSNPQVDAKTQLEFSTAVIDLSKRSQTLQFLRETLFRLCEQSLNNNLSSDQVMQLYELAVKTALVMAQSELAKQQGQLVKQQADLSRLLADPAVRKMWSEMTAGSR